MKLLAALVFVFACSHHQPVAPPSASTASSAPSLAGPWHGSVEIPGQTLAIDVHFVSDEAGTIDVPAQGAEALPLSNIQLGGGAIAFDLAQVGASFHGKLAGDTITGAMTQSGQSFPFKLARGAAASQASSPPVRSCNTPPADEPAPYHHVDVAIESTGGTVLAGTLTLPDVSARAAAVVMVTGSGPQDRDECVFGVRPFRQLADHLARHGIASLRYDDRGTAKSTGTFRGATADDFADDAHAAVRFLATRTEIDPRRIGVLGHSEGGIVAPLVASRDPAIAFIVLWAAPGQPMATVDLDQTELMLRADGAPESAVHDAVASETAVIAALRASHDDASLEAALRDAARTISHVHDADAWVKHQMHDNAGAWIRWYVDYTPASTLAKVHCPVLALAGGLDTQVPPRHNLPALRTALAHNPRATVRELPGLNHLFQRATTGGPSEYAKLAATIDDAVLDATSTWIAEQAPR